MKFTDAVELGSTLVKLDSHVWLTADKKHGCLVGMAMVAEGIVPETQVNTSYLEYGMQNALTKWPWLNKTVEERNTKAINIVSELAHAVANKHISLNSAIHQIRVVEKSLTRKPRGGKKTSQKDLFVAA